MPEVPVEQLNALHGRLAQLESESASRALEVQAEKARAMLATGQADAVVAAHAKELAQTKQNAAKFAASSALMQALGAAPLRPYALQQVHDLLIDECIADEAGDGRGYVTRTRAFQPIEVLVKERLSSPTFAHFLATGKSTPPATPGATSQSSGLVGEPKNLGEAYVRDHQQVLEDRRAKYGTSDGRTNPTLSFGLGKQRYGQHV